MSLRELAHWISKDARYKIIEVMLSTRSIRQLAEELGVSATAINKYIYRKTHPSDNTIARALSILGEYERNRIIQIIIDDITRAIELLANMVKDEDREIKEYFLNKLEKIIEKVKGLDGRGEAPASGWKHYRGL